MDDLLLQTTTRSEHLTLLAELLHLLEGAGLKLNPKKVQLLKSEVTYLGIKINEGRRTPDSHKVEFILPLETSSSCISDSSEVILGIVGFCTELIKGFANMKASELSPFRKKEK